VIEVSRFDRFVVLLFAAFFFLFFFVFGGFTVTCGEGEEGLVKVL